MIPDEPTGEQVERLVDVCPQAAQDADDVAPHDEGEWSHDRDGVEGDLCQRARHLRAGAGDPGQRGALLGLSQVWRSKARRNTPAASVVSRWGGA